MQVQRQDLTGPPCPGIRRERSNSDSAQSILDAKAQCRHTEPFIDNWECSHRTQTTSKDFRFNLPAGVQCGLDLRPAVSNWNGLEVAFLRTEPHVQLVTDAEILAQPSKTGPGQDVSAEKHRRSKTAPPGYCLDWILVIYLRVLARIQDFGQGSHFRKRKPLP